MDLQGATCTHHIKILIKVHIHSPSLKIPECMNMLIFFTSQIELLDARYLLLHCKVSISAMEALSFHITIVYAKYWSRIGFQAICDVTNPAHKPRLFKSDFH